MRVQLNLVKNDITVIDNYLPESEFVKIYDYVRSDIPWTLSSKSNPNSLKDWQFQFMHPKMEKEGQNLPSEFLPMIMGPYHVKFASGVAIIRSRINLFIKTKSFPFSFLKRGMGYHSDDFEEWKDIDGYKKSILQDFRKLKDSPLERAESLEQLRFIDNDIPIQTYETKHSIFSVDTQIDLIDAIEYATKVS